MERRRREEMAALLGSPLRFSKGNGLSHSMCDQLKEATNYVTHQKEKIQELWVKSGIEVVIRGGNESRICVADVVAILEESGLEVKSCSSSCSRESLFHFLRCEVCEGKEIDIIDIQEKLRHLFQR
ncbi:hypothetical protein AMTRI_Chr09g36660 [Amborella trichopoda]